MLQDDKFDGEKIEIVAGDTHQAGYLEFYYGGLGEPGGPGFGHIISHDGSHIHYWRRPDELHPVLDDKQSTVRLSY